MAKAGVLALLYLLAFLGGGTGGALAQDENGTTSAAIQKLTELIDYDTGDFADFSNIEESVQEYAAASDAVTCEPIPEEEWGDPTPDCTEFVELDGKRKKLVNSIDGAWPSVAGTVGRIFTMGNGSAVLMPNGTVLGCVTTMHWSDTYTDLMQSACWVPTSNTQKVVRVSLKLPLLCQSYESYEAGEWNYALSQKTVMETKDFTPYKDMILGAEISGDTVLCNDKDGDKAEDFSSEDAISSPTILFSFRALSIGQPDDTTLVDAKSEADMYELEQEITQNLDSAFADDADGAEDTDDQEDADSINGNIVDPAWAKAMEDYAAASDKAGCAPIPSEQLSTNTSECQYSYGDGDFWTSIAGPGRSVANDIGQSIADGAYLLVNGSAVACYTTMDYSANFSDVVQSACWPQGQDADTEYVRVVLKLPLLCGGFLDSAGEATDMDVSGDLMLCGDDPGEDQRSFRVVSQESEQEIEG